MAVISGCFSYCINYHHAEALGYNDSMICTEEKKMIDSRVLRIVLDCPDAVDASHFVLIDELAVWVVVFV